MPINDKQMAKLRKIVTAYENDHIVTMTVKSSRVLVDNGLVDIVSYVEGDPREHLNPEVTPTRKGIDLINGVVCAEPEREFQNMTTENTSEFEIETGIEPKGRKSRGGWTKYPFDDLDVGASFFVPATEGTPEPLKTLTGACSQANRRYSEVTGEKEVTRTDQDGNDYVKTIQDRVYHRRFHAEADEKKGVAGARAFRDQ